MTDTALLAEIERALARITPLAEQHWDQAVSIQRQLLWCRGCLTGQVPEERPGPFSMGLIAVREFDMYGNDPELASLINRIQDAMNRKLGEPD
ncbi:MAG TPA: hypothetical protein VG817_01860 [Gemmatimonadales bacterium]|nr:hypothetical protein [Gemmatimonadales bacterium]